MSYKSKPLPLTFACAATESKLFPSDMGNEIALCGRSNSGKSTLINALANQKKLAKTSNTPGRTQSINFFHLTNDEAKKIVDLPGFGYAKASKQDQNAWAKLILSYLEKRSALTDLILIMDMRHPFQNKDLEFLSLCESLNLPIHLVLTKADKLNNKETQKTLKVVSEKMVDYPAIVDSLVFSATKKIGLETLLNKIKLLLEV
ncbi:MAG: YihA family ribosome biogenesis GTP-binding protein [Gammaproteobacteria bacterium]|nr:YihA family ribosome biogenesis GTP-binding protein [Gammaproteobacteria bacterium]|tara:strand:+ start:210 stop:818 length:609 start_codon:yes stop_codon:yes gene_type:complete